MTDSSKGNVGFVRDIDAAGQRRGLIFCGLAFGATGVLAILGQTLPPLLDIRPVSSLWMLPAAFAALSALFAGSYVALRLKGVLLWLWQLLAAITVVAALMAPFLWLGQEPPPLAQWWDAVTGWGDASHLVVTSGCAGLLLGWGIHPVYPFRGAIVAVSLIFCAVWMDFQGYYAVITDGNVSIIGTGHYGATTQRGDASSLQDGGAAVATLFFATLAAWTSLLLWAFIKRWRERDRGAP